MCALLEKETNESLVSFESGIVQCSASRIILTIETCSMFQKEFGESDKYLLFDRGRLTLREMMKRSATTHVVYVDVDVRMPQKKRESSYVAGFVCTVH
jgi:hypothetical protein